MRGEGRQGARRPSRHAVYEEIDRLQKEPVPADELQKVKNQAKANAYRRLVLADVHHVPAPDLRRRSATGSYINTYAGRGGRGDRGRPPARGQEHLTQETRTVGIFLRKERRGAPGRPRARRAARRERQAMATQSAAADRGRDATPPSCREGIAQLQAMARPGAAGDEAGALDLILKTRPGAAGAPSRRKEVSAMSRPRPRRPAGRVLGVPPCAQPIPDQSRQAHVPAASAYAPPRAQDYRAVLKNGMVVFIAGGQDAARSSTCRSRVRDGRLPRARRARRAWPRFTGSQIRRGGTKSLSAGAARRAARLPGRAGLDRHRRHRRLGVSLNCLGRQPRRGARGVRGDAALRRASRRTGCALAREQTLQEMKKRNDDSADIERARVERAALRRAALHQPLHAPRRRSSRSPATTWSGFHRQLLPAANMIAAVSGAFTRPT